MQAWFEGFKAEFDLNFIQGSRWRLLVDGLKEGVSGAVSGLGGWVRSLLGDSLSGGLSGLRTVFFGYGADAAQGAGSGFVGGVQSAFSRAYRSVCDVWQNLGEVFRRYGDSASQGLRGNLRSDVRRAFAEAYQNACAAWSGAGRTASCSSRRRRRPFR